MRIHRQKMRTFSKMSIYFPSRTIAERTGRRKVRRVCNRVCIFLITLLSSRASWLLWGVDIDKHKKNWKITNKWARAFALTYIHSILIRSLSGSSRIFLYWRHLPWNDSSRHSVWVFFYSLSHPLRRQHLSGCFIQTPKHQRRVSLWKGRVASPTPFGHQVVAW